MERKAVRAVILNGDKMLAMHRNKAGTEYYTLVGGGVEPGEDDETALRRELREEVSLEVGKVSLVFIEEPGERFGQQAIYLCEYLGGEPHLAADSPEASDSQLGHNTYEPVWLPMDEVAHVPFRSAAVREALLNAVQNGFPDEPQVLAWKG